MSDSSYVVFEHNDPRILGDHYSEVYKIVSFIGTENEALKHYKQRKNMLKFAGTNSTSFSYPIRLKDHEKALQVGDKVTIHPEKDYLTDEERVEQYEDGW